MTREQIDALDIEGVENRMAEISGMLDSEDADFDALTAEVELLEARKKALQEAAQKRTDLRAKVAAGAGVVKTDETPKEGRSAVAERLVKENRMTLPMFRENRSVLVSSGKLATPKAVYNEIGALPSVISSIIDDVDAVDATGTGSWDFPYQKTAAAAADVTEGQTVGGTGATFDKVTIGPSEWGVLDEVSNQVKKMTPVGYAAAVQNAAFLALRRKAKEKITAAILASDLAEKVYSVALDDKFVRNVVLGYDSDESVAGGTKMYINKADLSTLGKVRGTNEKKAVYEISFTDENNGVIKDGGTQIAFSINSSVPQGTQLYGKPATVKMLMWDNYEISTDDGGDYFKRNMLGVRGIQTAGADLTVWHGMQIIRQSAEPSGE